MSIHCFGENEEIKTQELIRKINFSSEIKSVVSFLTDTILPFSINALDTVEFDIHNANFTSGYFEFPVTIISDDSINALDFSFEFNNANYVYDTVYPVISPISYLAHYNEADLRFRFTSFSFTEYPINNSIVYVGFSVLDFSFCELNIFAPVAYLNGEPCSTKITDCPVATSLTQKELLTFNIYPNPSSDLINVSIKEKSVVYLFDALGKLIHQTDAENEHVQLPVSNLPEGIYLVKIVTNNSVFSDKIIVYR
jgi:hypothetical protein